MNAVYARYFEEAILPVLVQVSRLPKDVLVEIDCIAVIASGYSPSSTLSIYQKLRSHNRYLLFSDALAVVRRFFWASTQSPESTEMIRVSRPFFETFEGYCCLCSLIG